MADGRVPPNDLEAEAAVLSACLLSRDALDEVSDMLRPEHFYAPAHGLVWAAIHRLDGAGGAVDVVTVGQALRAAGELGRVGGSSWLGNLVDATPAVANVREHAEIVTDLARLRAVIRAGHEIASDGYQAAAKAAEYPQEAEARLWAATSDAAPRGGLEPVKAALTQAFASMADGTQRGSGTATGLYDLDRLTTGMHRGDLWIVAARPGMGKSAAALGVARHVVEQQVAGVHDRWAAVFSLEMPKDQLAARMACSEAGVDLARFRDGRLGDDDWKRLTAAAAHLTGLPLHIDDSPGLEVAAIRSRARRLASQAAHAGARLGLVVVDYLQLMRHPRLDRGSTRDQAIGETTRGLKCLAKELECPVMALSQLNREVDKRTGKYRGRPQLSDLRESGNIEQDSDVVMFIYRADYYRQLDDDPERDHKAEIIVAKQRNGPTGKVVVRFEASCARFRSLEPTWEEAAE